MVPKLKLKGAVLECVLDLTQPGQPSWLLCRQNWHSKSSSVGGGIWPFCVGSDLPGLLVTRAINIRADQLASLSPQYCSNSVSGIQPLEIEQHNAF